MIDCNPTRSGRKQLEISSHVVNDGVVRLAVAGDIDESAADHLHDVIVHAAQGAAQVVVDLTGVGVCDSAGVGAVVHACTRLNGQGVEVQVKNLHAANHR
ncbi:STAS domain-containing protein [Actinoplanes sp. NPDC024001]